MENDMGAWDMAKAEAGARFGETSSLTRDADSRPLPDRDHRGQSRTCQGGPRTRWSRIRCWMFGVE